MIFNPRPYQSELIDSTLDRLDQGGGVAWWVDMGGGKTVCALNVARSLRDWWGVRKTLIVAPLKVAYLVWPYEADKWETGLTTSIVHGSPAKRKKALAEDRDLYLINPEGIAWLSKQEIDFDFIVIDESSKFKNWGAQRTKALRKIIPDIPRRLELTGTPSPKSYEDVFAQIYMLDEGEALGKTVGYFRSNYCHRGGFKGRQWQFKEGRAKALEASVSHLVTRMDVDDFAIDLPPQMVQDVRVDLPTDIRKAYRKVERDLFAELDSGANLAASSAGAKYVLCRGIANGGAYVENEDGERVAEYLHAAKVDAVADIVEETYGAPLLVAYQFNHDRDRLLERFPQASVIAGGVSPKKSAEIIDRWGRGEVSMLLAQCQALSHGVDRLQHAGRHVVWFGCSDQLEVYLQFNARIHRSGVKGPVMVHRILAADTVDEAIVERLDDKDASQKSLLDSLKAYRERAKK